jgi:hypothetical protein
MGESTGLWLRKISGIRYIFRNNHHDLKGLDLLVQENSSKLRPDLYTQQNNTFKQ